MRLGIAILGFAVLAGVLAAKVDGESVDDVFITYRYAQNLVEGNGLVFNPGERVLATTAPGWALLLALGHALSGVAIPSLGTWGSGAFLVAIAALLLAEGQRRGRGLEALAAGLLSVTCVYFWTHNGFELPLALFLCLLAARLAARFPAAAGLLAGAAFWARPDMALVGAGVGLLLLLESRGRLSRSCLRFGAAFTLTIAAGLLAATLYYGHPLPVTLEAKRAQVEWRPEAWRGGLDFWVEGYRWLSRGYAGPHAPILAILGAIGLAVLARLPSRPCRLLAWTAGVLFIAYPVLGVPFYTWYSIPLLLALIYGACFLVGAALRRIHRAPWGRWPRLAAAALVLATVLPGVHHVTRRAVLGYLHFQGIPRAQVYRQAGLWLDAHAAPDADIAFVEVGTVAFYGRRPVRDLLGLISPENLPHVHRGDLAAAFRDSSPDYLLDSPRLRGLLETVLQTPEFHRSYEAAAEFRVGDEEVVIYRRVTPARSTTALKPNCSKTSSSLEISFGERI